MIILPRGVYSTVYSLFDVKNSLSRKYSRRVGESVKSWESEGHFIVGIKKECPRLLPLFPLIRAE